MLGEETPSAEQEDIVVLRDFVRKQYCSHLEKVLTQNYITWYCKNLDLTHDTNPPRDWLKKCTSLYEDEALKKCMVLHYYRKEMLEIISSIRKNTCIGKLAEKIKFYSEDSVNVNQVCFLKPFNVDVCTQTEEVSGIQENKVDTTGCSSHEFLSLDNKIELFKERFHNKIDKKKNKRTNYLKNIETHPYCSKKLKIRNDFSEIKTDIFKYLTPSPINSPSVELRTDKKDDFIRNDIDKELNVIFGTENDEIEEELDKLFKDDDDFSIIFGCNEVTLDDPRNENIMKELENAKFSVPFKKTETKKEFKTNPDKLIKERITMLSNNKEPNDEMLKESLWPCELNMRKQKLSEILGKVDDIVVMDRIKNKFTELFGPEIDEEDDFVIYSPSLELNLILLGSCMKRIAPWIVKHLMRPMNDGLIANRYLFKKLAKMLAKRIVEENQYPSERYVKEKITDFFCQRKRVDIIDDILIS